ncbi:MAG: GNAT family N-acetyltransferase [Micropruina sp.]
MRVTTWSLQMASPAPHPPRPLPREVRFERAAAITPEYARFLYALVGGNWFWLDRLRWSREQWVEELAVPGREFWVLYGEGVPLGYLHLHPAVKADGTHVEIRYFGLAEEGLGRHLGGPLLEHGIAAAWSISERSGLPPVVRVWVHTCSLDGPAALTNYQARGLEIFATEETDEDLPRTSPGAWVASGGQPSDRTRAC